MTKTMIEIEQLQFAYPKSEFRLIIDHLEVKSGEKVAVVGPSGSGKTTLLNLISGIIVPESGSVKVDEIVVSNQTDSFRRNFRIANIGFIFQQFELVEYLRVADNIRLPFLINQSLTETPESKGRIKELAQAVGIGDKLNRWVRQLSQGEQQRVAICRALLTEPKLIIADEPTGNLDPANKQRILNVLFQQVERGGQTLIVVTHDMAILDGFDRVIDFEQFRQISHEQVEEAAQ